MYTHIHMVCYNHLSISLNVHVCLCVFPCVRLYIYISVHLYCPHTNTHKECVCVFRRIFDRKIIQEFWKFSKHPSCQISWSGFVTKHFQTSSATLSWRHNSKQTDNVTDGNEWQRWNSRNDLLILSPIYASKLFYLPEIQAIYNCIMAFLGKP